MSRILAPTASPLILPNGLTIWVGGLLQGWQAARGESPAVQHIINLAAGDPDARYASDLVQVHPLEQDDAKPVPLETLQHYYQLVDRLSKPTLIHCHMGISRAPSFAIAWYIRLARQLDPARSAPELWAEAENRLRMTRPFIQPHHLLKASILAGYPRLHSVFSSEPGA